MSSVAVLPIGELSSHEREVVDLAVETHRYFRIAECSPEAARAFWERITEEFTEQAGLTPQEFEGLSWVADMYLKENKAELIARGLLDVE